MIYRVYVFLDQMGNPYYVGKTNNFKRRRREHLYEIKIGNTLPKYRKARALIKKGYKFRMKTIATARTEAEVFRLERKYIKEFRAKYTLYNLTHGGPYKKPAKISHRKPKVKRSFKHKSKVYQKVNKRFKKNKKKLLTKRK